MPKFVVFGDLSPLAGFLPSAEAAGALISRGVTNPILRQLLRLHMSSKLNRIIPLPFKGIWSRAFMKGLPVSEDDNVYFVFRESSKLAYSEDCLKYLREKYRRAKLIFYFWNPLVGPHTWLIKRWNKIKYLYDAGITPNRSDAEKHGLLFIDYWPCLLPEKEYQPQNASDVFFIGQAKNRFSYILDIYERLSDAGLKCDFWVTGVPKTEQKYSDVIHYKSETSYTWINYDDILQRCKNTRCILEIIAYDQNYATIRVNEAVRYHRKLLTTNREAPMSWFYNPETVQVFSKPSEIDTNFVTKALTQEDEHRIFDSIKVRDFGAFEDFLIKNVHRK